MMTLEEPDHDEMPYCFCGKAFAQDCPRCGRKAMCEVGSHGALSRADNATYICSPCGTEQALLDYIGRYSST